MPCSTYFTGPRARMIALLFVGWVAFFTSLNLLGAVMAPAAAPRRFDPGAVEVVAAIVWTVLTVAVAAYHARLRTKGFGLFVLIAAHLPLLCVASFADGFFTSWAMRTFTTTPSKLSVTALAV